ncbi:FAD/NAD(P)-binding domain-containing protein [Linnemannia elongata AG-77]|uniref:FAD/NAD(P)-binding domain-containing protein n=1 Tax=Linnemannia elongata AG-77 TaxID=1314771 RepID=A0A197JHK3_9FUNG|nr:FAD/NAD(P)-binding domain-containing protein [Linnemannia elongata AG-77]
MSATVATPRPTVLIVGAGLGGVMLGALLERANIPYAIFERASAVKPLGSAMSLAGQVMYLFRQLGIDERFIALSKYSRFGNFRHEDGSPIPPADFIAMEEFLIPPKKIHFSKRILTISEEDDKVKIQAADNTVYEGDILVGADGAYSAVRQQLYNRLKKAGTLPKSDHEDLPFSCTCLVGQTDPLDLEEYPELKNPKEPFVTTFATGKPFTWTIFSTKQNTLCFMVLEHLSSKTSKAAQEQRFRNTDNSEWGPHAAQAMCDETRDYSISFGGGKKTLGDIYDKTPKERIVKVMLEEKVFKTWSSGRTVLLGDACHKVNPAAGVGAITAMHDAIALANLIYALPANTSEEITKTFKEYHAERYPPAMEAYNNSLLMSKLLKGGIAGAIAWFLKNNMPNWLWRLAVKGLVMNRLQAGFLKPVEDKGTVPPNISPSTEKARALYNKRMGVAAAV